MRLLESVRSLNFLYRTSVCSDKSRLYYGGLGRPSSSQMSILNSLDDRISLYGSRPQDLTPLDALNEVCKAKDLYTQEPQHMAPYLPDKLKVTKGVTTPLPMESLLPERTLDQVVNFRQHRPEV